MKLRTLLILGLPLAIATSLLGWNYYLKLGNITATLLVLVVAYYIYTNYIK